MSVEDTIRTVITGALLAAFVVIFVQETVSIWRRVKPSENEARTYVWTAISVLIGSVTAFLLGVEFPKRASIFNVSPPEWWRGAYAVVYSVIGLAALITWYSRTEWSSVLMKNLATTFLGIAVPVVSGWLI